MTDDRDAQERAETVAARMIERDRMIDALGIAIDAVAPGYAEARMTVAETMANSFGMAHGGAVFALADAAFSYACNVGPHRAVATHCTIHYLAPAKPGDRLTATGRKTAEAGRSSVYDVTVADEEGAAIALFRGTARRVDGLVLPGLEEGDG